MTDSAFWKVALGGCLAASVAAIFSPAISEGRLLDILVFVGVVAIILTVATLATEDSNRLDSQAEQELKGRLDTIQAQLTYLKEHRKPALPEKGVLSQLEEDKKRTAFGGIEE